MFSLHNIYLIRALKMAKLVRIKKFSWLYSRWLHCNIAKQTSGSQKIFFWQSHGNLCKSSCLLQNSRVYRFYKLINNFDKSRKISRVPTYCAKFIQVAILIDTTVVYIHNTQNILTTVASISRFHNIVSIIVKTTHLSAVSIKRLYNMSTKSF